MTEAMASLGTEAVVNRPALLADFEESGLYDESLVVVAGVD